MGNWMDEIIKMLRRHPIETRPDDEEVERDRLRHAQIRLRRLDLQADIIARRSGKTHE